MDYNSLIPRIHYLDTEIKKIKNEIEESQAWEISTFDRDNMKNVLKSHLEKEHHNNYANYGDCIEYKAIYTRMFGNTITGVKCPICDRFLGVL